MEAVKRANQPGQPEESIVFRVASAASVVVAIAACWHLGELPPEVALPAIVLTIVGNFFSYWRRANPLPWLKLILAVATIGAFVWFIPTVSGHASAGNLGSVEGPLAILFTWIQVTHSFDVPSRRDLGFSLAGSATLMAVAAAQAESSGFGFFVMLWSVIGFVGLLAMWGSMSGGGKTRARTVVVAAMAVTVVAVVVVALLPAPHASTALVFPSSVAHDVDLGPAGGLVGGGASGSEPVHAGSANGQTRVGGFLGFAGPLDTAIRGSLGNQVVMRVRADRPSFWTAETFNNWNGRSWIETKPSDGSQQFEALNVGPPFSVPVEPGTDTSSGSTDIQTFYLAVAGPNLVFHAGNAAQVWFPASRIFVSGEGTIRAGTTMGPGSIYTVESFLSTATAAQLSAATPENSPGDEMSPADQARYTQLPAHNPYANVAALAKRITAHATNNYEKVTELEAWIGTHTHYTTNIPPLAAGQDTVEEFLFGNRKGYCEQISTSLAVMLRTLGIPSRESTGYVPGPYNPITDLYDVQAKDAHAWVQVWFPGYGWQNFDPTAHVPLANPTPGSVLTHDIGDGLRRLPLVPLALALAVFGALYALWRHQRLAPRTWAARMTRELEHAAARGGIEKVPRQTLSSLGFALDALWTDEARPVPSPSTLAAAAERAAFGGVEPDPATKAAYAKAAHELRPPKRTVTPPDEPGPHPNSRRQPVAV